MLLTYNNTAAQNIVAVTLLHKDNKSHPFYNYFTAIILQSKYFLQNFPSNSKKILGEADSYFKNISYLCIVVIIISNTK